MNSNLRQLAFVLFSGLIIASIFADARQVPAAAPAAPAQGRDGSAPTQGRGGRGAGGFGRVGLPPVILADADYIKWPLLASQQAYADIDGNHMKSLVKEIVAISEKSRTDGNQNWGRHAGTIDDKMTRDWVVQRFQRIGLEGIRDQPVTQAPRWWPNSWEASIVSRGKTTALKTVVALGGDSTPTAGVDLPIVWVGLGAAADFQGKDVKGRRDAAVDAGVCLHPRRNQQAGSEADSSAKGAPGVPG